MGDVTAHGGLVEDELAALGLRAADILDVSVNVNPYGPCAAVRDAVAEAALHRYPDPTAAPARRALAELSAIDASRVVVGNGAVDLLWTLARTALRPGDPVLIVEPAFSEMRAAATRVGAEIVPLRTAPEAHFALDLAALDGALRRHRPRLVYLCTPSNPAGVCTPISPLEDLAARHPDALFVVDLSFLSLSERHAEAWGSARVTWIRSLTKDHALAGLRVGYGVMPPTLAARVEAERPPWSVNALAQAAAVATTRDEARRFVDACRARMLADRAHLVGGLRTLGLAPHPSETVYVLVDLGPTVAARDLRRALLVRHGVLVRDCTSFGLPHHLRLAARPPRDVDRVLTALHRELHP